MLSATVGEPTGCRQSPLRFCRICGGDMLEEQADERNVSSNRVERAVCGRKDVLLSATQVRDPKITPPEVVLQAQHPLSVSGVRTASTNFSPQPACALINFRTAVASRRFRSWMFLPPAMDSGSLLGDNFQTTNAYWTSCVTLNSAYTTGTANAATRWTGTTLTNYSLCCYSKRAELLSTDSVALILSTSLSKRVRWLRSRQRGTS